MVSLSLMTAAEEGDTFTHRSNSFALGLSTYKINCLLVLSRTIGKWSPSPQYTFLETWKIGKSNGQILGKYCAKYWKNIVQVLGKYCTFIGHLLCKYWANMWLWKYWDNIRQIFGIFCANIEQILDKYCVKFGQILV